MGYTKKFLGLKLNTTAYQNPQTGVSPLASLGNAAVAYSSGVPCRGARQVHFTIKGAGSGALASQTVIPGNIATMVDAVNASGGDVSVQGDGNFGIGLGNGLVVAARPSLLSVFSHGYLSLTFTNDANTKTNVTVDAEVLYEAEADMCMASYGQGGEAIL